MIEIKGYRILIKQDSVEKETEFGIVLVEDEKLQKHRLNTGTVVGVGSVAYKAYSSDYTGEPWVELNDRVVYSQYSGKYITDPTDDEEYVVVNDEDIIAVIREG